ncbi:MAG TPA: hypothetical protein VM029_00960 [Opitutaceae bacterium]|nr:hypothetical protein [Opitutaceae bacterium]
MKGLRTGILALVAVGLTILLFWEHAENRRLESEVAAFRQQKSEFADIRAAHDRLVRTAAEANDEILRLRAELASVKTATEKSTASR